MPDVSIVIPCHNGHPFLERAVASALGQDLASKEVIVVDDGSTAPETRGLLNRLPDGVRVVRQGNRGVAAARNRGFMEARGRYVLPLDCDDRIEPDYARRALELIAGREDAFVHSWIAVFGDYELVLRKDWDPFKQLIMNQLPYCILMPKALWRRLGGYDEAMRLGCEDWELGIRLALAGARGLCIPEPMLHYRVAGTGMLQTVTRRRYGEIWRSIQRKHRQAYRTRHLIPAVGERPRQRLGPFLVLYCTHRLLPPRVFTRLYLAGVGVRELLRRLR